MKRLDGDEEVDYDLKGYKEHPGAQDSEIECDDDDDDVMGVHAEALADRQMHEEEDVVAKIDTFVDIVASQQEEIRLQTEAEIVVKKEEDEEANIVSIPGALFGWKPPSAPEDWKPARVRANAGGPDMPFHEVDNPGGWSRFCFCPKYKTTGKKKSTDVQEGVETEDDPEGAPTDKAKFMCYAMLTGATPVPLNVTTKKRAIAECDFHCDGWEATENTIRSGAACNNPFPANRLGSLDGDKLFDLGLTCERMEDATGKPDALFFYLLLLPLHDKNNERVSTVPNDPHTSFYMNCARWSNMHVAGELNILGAGYGHEFKQLHQPNCYNGAVLSSLMVC